MKFKVTAPGSFVSERTYIIDTLLSDFLGISYELDFQAGQKQTVISAGGSEKSVVMPDVFFAIESSEWLTGRSLPVQPLLHLDRNGFPGDPALCSDDIPVIFGTNEAPVYDGSRIYIPVDIFGSSFFMLTRYEEVVKEDRDVHGRFSSVSSISIDERFIDRPIVNEYLEILWSAIKCHWPDIKRKHRDFKLLLTHDVDRPFQFAFTGVSGIIRIAGADIIRRHSFGRSMLDIKRFISVKTGRAEADPYNTFDLIMDISENAGMKSCFYFISERYGKEINGDYDIDHPYMAGILKNIDRRGHEIGLHLSYDSFNDPEKIKNELKRLAKVCSENGIKQEIRSSRQHYLRFSVPSTWRFLADAGINYDSSAGYADMIGFRCGTCYEFPVYDVVERRKLDITERPLMVMERTLLDRNYMNLTDLEDAAIKVKKLIDAVSKYNGQFVLLWHNNRFLEKTELELYREIVNYAVKVRNV